MGEPLSRLASALAGRYAIERQVGAGGMATVYLARDIRHNRRVALKVLKPEIGGVLGPERFLSEIETTANLQHPHLLPLFDSGEVDGLLFYVMPYVEGETLRHRLERERQLPVDEAIRITVAVAHALDYAHRHNVVHRDLKPENILLHEGQPLVMDFGIALAVSNAGGTRITETGLSLGTPQYMSPEQATGDRLLDGRTDIFSLGAVLYEMLTGEPPHSGATAAAIIAKVLTERPPSVRATRESVPEHVDAVIRKALSKLAADRFSTAEEFAKAVTGVRPVTVTREAAGEPRARSRAEIVRQWAPWGIAAAAVATAGVMALSMLNREEAGARNVPVRVELTLPDSARHRPILGWTLALSPDGSELLYVGGASDRTSFYLRRLDDPRPRVVAGTEGAGFPAGFSPDGRWILFKGADLKIRKVALQGGAPVTLAESDGWGSASWSDRNEIIFVQELSLWRISEDGGERTLIARPDSARGHLGYGFHEVLPGGRAALITIWKQSLGVDGAHLGVVTIPDGQVTELGVIGTNPRYVTTGHVLFGRRGGSAFVAPFSLRQLRLTGRPVLVLDNVVVKGGGAVDIAVARNGTLSYIPARSESGSELVIVDRAGRSRVVHSAAELLQEPRISPDGRRVVMRVGADVRGDILVYDVAAGTPSKITFDRQSRYAEWTRDGQRVAFTTYDGVRNVLTWMPYDGGGTPELLVRSERSVLSFSIGPPGSSIAVALGGDPAQGPMGGSGTQGDLFVAPVDSPAAVRPFLMTAADEDSPSISPDGRWIAYVSDESGRREVYVRPLTGPGPRAQISVDGGTEPVWGRSGREVFYRAETRMLSARVELEPEARVSRRDMLFPDTSFDRAREGAGYDVMPNDKELLMVRRSTGASSDPVVVVNWTEELKRRLARK